MDRIGRFTIILATLLLVEFEPWPCRAQTAALPATSIPPAQTGATSAPPSGSPRRSGRPN